MVESISNLSEDMEVEERIIYNYLLFQLSLRAVSQSISAGHMINLLLCAT